MTTPSSELNAERPTWSYGSTAPLEVDTPLLVNRTLRMPLKVRTRSLMRAQFKLMSPSVVVSLGNAVFRMSLRLGNIIKAVDMPFVVFSVTLTRLLRPWQHHQGSGHAVCGLFQ